MRAKAKKGRSTGVEGSQADQESIGGPRWVGDPWKRPPGFRYLGHPSVLHISFATPGQKAFPAIVTRVPFTHCGNLQVPEGCLPSSCAAAQFAPVRAAFFSLVASSRAACIWKWPWQKVREERRFCSKLLQCCHVIYPSVDQPMQGQCPAGTGRLTGAWIDFWGSQACP